MGFDFAGTYDELNPGRADHRFYAGLAGELGATRVLDLGCGTGTLTAALAAEGRHAIGIDPDPAMLRVARRHAGVEWRLGRSDLARPAEADFAVMTGHAAQVFLDDGAWARTLQDLHRALVPGGVLAFESRNPGARGWERWTRADTLRILDTDDGPVEFWHETTSVALPLVSYDTFTRDIRKNRVESVRDTLAFRRPAELLDALAQTDFKTIQRYGDWTRSPLAPDSPEVILVARKPG